MNGKELRVRGGSFGFALLMCVLTMVGIYLVTSGAELNNPLFPENVFVKTFATLTMIIISVYSLHNSIFHVVRFDERNIFIPKIFGIGEKKFDINNVERVVTHIISRYVFLIITVENTKSTVLVSADSPDYLDLLAHLKEYLNPDKMDITTYESLEAGKTQDLIQKYNREANVFIYGVLFLLIFILGMNHL